MTRVLTIAAIASFVSQISTVSAGVRQVYFFLTFAAPVAVLPAANTSDYLHPFGDLAAAKSNFYGAPGK